MENHASYLRLLHEKINETACTGHDSEDYDYLSIGRFYTLEGTCTTEDCTKPVLWEIGAALTCCHRIAPYCRECAVAQWYQSGLFGRRCPDHNVISPLTYHPRKIGGTGKCLSCPDTCPVWGPAATL